ncbi:hypothetical protein G7076_08095 [Sphingomonas sp. HDW15A]|uniref:hypothetical protein n=1 Tax=Sphingomonas sp. HDW15A TaxID=2714942 RepID=UPI001409EA5A|nr:hypothetical protein [Sphingomonas sp. HDW15A]QIK96408.1 hypothetical protein G7076_08095 [Sphingomonas sp. HDW15A]
MNRVLFVDMEKEMVISRCKAEDVGISALEALPTGGIRLVCKSSDGAEVMTRKLKRHLIGGDVTRAPFRPRKTLW